MSTEDTHTVNTAGGQCPNCGSTDTNPGVMHIGTGEVYCSTECADEHAEETAPPAEAQRSVLDYVIEKWAKGDTANLRDLADASEYGVEELVRCESELYPAVNCGTPVCPWPWKREEAERLYESWGAEPPGVMDAADWVDT